MKANPIKHLFFPLVLAAAWIWAVQYTFNSKPDLNGDNFCYYIYASSLAEGEGYCDLSAPGSPVTANFPPGYPILMAPLRMVTDSIVAQKWLNEIFLLLSILLLYFTLLRLGLPLAVSFSAAMSAVFLPRLLHFSTMMMSEASFLFFSVLLLYAMVRMSEKEESWYAELKSPWFYVMLIALLMTYHIRTQGLALVAAVGLALLIRRRWGALLGTVGGFILGCLPWVIRNKVMGIHSGRYFDVIAMANPWRPEEGTLSLWEVVERFFGTLKMLVFNAIPNTIVPFVKVNCDAPSYNWWIYIIGIVLLVIIGYGCWQMGKVKWLMMGYIAATLGLISIFSTPSGNRYITTILPWLSIPLFVGLASGLLWLIQRRWKNATFPAYILLLLLFLSTSGMREEHAVAQQRFPVAYKNFFAAGKEVQKIAEKDAVICSRKPQMMYVYSSHPGVCYLFSTDPKAVIEDLVKKNVDYVVLDALGYGSTPRYLYPAIVAYPQLFPIVKHYDASHTYLLHFQRAQAAKVIE